MTSTEKLLASLVWYCEAHGRQEPVPAKGYEEHQVTNWYKCPKCGAPLTPKKAPLGKFFADNKDKIVLWTLVVNFLLAGFTWMLFPNEVIDSFTKSIWLILLIYQELAIVMLWAGSD